MWVVKSGSSTSDDGMVMLSSHLLSSSYQLARSLYTGHPKSDQKPLTPQLFIAFRLAHLWKGLNIVLETGQAILWLEGGVRFVMDAPSLSTTVAYWMYLEVCSFDDLSLSHGCSSLLTRKCLRCLKLSFWSTICSDWSLTIYIKTLLA